MYCENMNAALPSCDRGLSGWPPQVAQAFSMSGAARGEINLFVSCLARRASAENLSATAPRYSAVARLLIKFLDSESRLFGEEVPAYTQ